MRSPAHGALRALRAGVLAAVVLGISLAAHVAGGGQLPSPAALALLLGALVVPCLALTAARLSRGGALGVLGVGQLLVHRALCAMAPAMTAPTRAAGAASTEGVAHGVLGVLQALGGPTTVSLPMLAAHAAATVVLAAWVAAAEASLWRLSCWLGYWLVPVLVLVVRAVVLPARAPLLPAGEPARSHRTLLASAVGRRGPPVVAAG